MEQEEDLFMQSSINGSSNRCCILHGEYKTKMEREKDLKLKRRPYVNDKMLIVDGEKKSQINTNSEHARCIK
ncbi:hypothetical protein FRX31_002114 [Thalictrum thalictroides]|uniref:Uncharacterized protein n=1 Tax=Thalictrum thalictroides TaxID=46969 RepID=A0A7J6XGJ3_THATH|nr:hypothetical protein FRX31_002114 [Thalictrum thalictroides]